MGYFSNDQHDEDSALIQFAGKITMAAIALLFMIVVIFFFLHIYARKYWWRAEDHDQRLENPRAVSAGQAASRVPTMREGLDKSILESLPLVVFSSEESKDRFECSVCLSEAVNGEKARLLPKCNHGFHVECIDMWFQSHSTCPLCRHPVSSPLASSEPEATTTIDVTVMMPGSSSGSLSFPILSHPHSAQAHVNDEGPSHRVIDIPMEIATEIFSSEARCSGDEAKSPHVLTRMQTFKRLLSRENSLVTVVHAPSRVDVHHLYP